MLDDDVEHHRAIVNAMRAWHTTQAAPPAGLGITANAENDVWEIEYGRTGQDGEEDEQAGSIRMNRENFEVTHVTDAEGEFVQITYNHGWPGDLNREVVRGALSCNALHTEANGGSRAVIILLCSEAARSVLVEKFVRAILGGNAYANGYATVRGLTREYGHTQEHVGGQIAAGAAWAPLQLQDHLNYSLYLKNERKVRNYFDGIHELNTYLNSLDA